MNILLFIASIVLPTMTGYTMFYKEETMTFIEKTIFSFTIGTGLLSFYLFFLRALNIPFSFLSVIPFFTPFFVIWMLRWNGIRRSVHFSAKSPLSGLFRYQKIIFSVLLLLIGFKLFYLLFIIFSVPTIFWDAYTLWNYKAKVIYFTNAVSGNFMEGPYSHYPLNLPIIKAWISFFIGRWSEPLVNLHSVILFMCLLGLVFTTLRKAIGKMWSMIFTYILASIPILTYNVISGYADMAVGYYLLAANIMLFYWHRTERTKFLIFAGIISSIAMFTKNEGVVIVFPALFFTFLFYLIHSRPSWKYVLRSIALFIVSSLLIFLWLKTSQALSTIIQKSGDLFNFHAEAVRPLIEQLFIFRNYNIFWVGIILIFALKWKRIFFSEAKFFIVPSVLSLGAILYVFLFTANADWVINATAINRTMLLVIPILTLSAGFLLAPEEK